MIRCIAIALPLLAVAGCGGGSESTQDASVAAEPTSTTVLVTTPATDAAVDGADTTLPSDTTTTESAATEDAESNEEEALKDTVSRYVAAFGEGDPDAAASLLSVRCSDIIPMAQYRAAVAGAGELYPGLVVDEFSDVVLDEDAAVVYYTTDPVVEADQGERWVVESGTWRWDDC